MFERTRADTGRQLNVIALVMDVYNKYPLNKLTVCKAWYLPWNKMSIASVRFNTNLIKTKKTYTCCSEVYLVQTL